jgi:purine nucleosidase
MMRPLHTAEYVHGPTGLDGADLPAPTMPLQPQHAVDFLVETLRVASEASVTLCTLGPLTNVGMALIMAPEIVPAIREIVMMGGAFFEGGNTTPAAEFNVWVDPHAAHLVFSSGIPITMMPLDVTHKALTSAARLQGLRDLGTPQGDAVAGLLDFYDRYDMDKYGTDGGPLHDPCVVAYLLEPEMFGGKRCHVAIATDDGPAIGMTLVDWWGVTGEEPNAMVMNEIDDAAFYELITDRVARLPMS